MIEQVSALPSRGFAGLSPAALIGSFSFFAIGIVTATLVALLVIARVRARFLRQAQEVSEANRLVRATFDQAAVGISLMDANGRWLRINDRFCRILGYSRDELLDRSFRDVSHPDDIPADAEMIEALLDGQAERRSMEKRYLHKDGHVVWVNLTRSFVPDGQSTPGFIVSVVEEIGARKEAEERAAAGEAELRLLRNEFAHLSRINDLGEMAAAIAHEINQPLAAISNYLSSGLYLAGRGYSEEILAQVTEDMKRASEQSLRAGEIVRQLRAFIGQDSGGRTAESVASLVDSAMALALIDARYEGIEVETEVEPGLEVQVDRVQIHQLLVNLLRNAVEAMAGAEPGRERRLGVSAVALGSDTVSFTVADTGPGIPPDVYDRLFQPFVTSKSNGMGMGLSVCQRIVNAHGGTIAVENRPGAGAAFTFRLPRLHSNGTR